LPAIRISGALLPVCIVVIGNTTRWTTPKVAAIAIDVIDLTSSPPKNCSRFNPSIAPAKRIKIKAVAAPLKQQITKLRCLLRQIRVSSCTRCMITFLKKTVSFEGTKWNF
jgi:hypothetical protein